MATSTPFLAGWASAEITPDIPCRMGGYAARSAPANATHDPLYTHALALGTQAQPLVVIVCDLVGVDETIVHEVREQVAIQSPGATVWLGATHTHSGPNVARSLSLTHEAPDPAIRERVIAGASSAAASAIERMHPVSVKWARGMINGIATNRDHPDKSADLSLDILCFYDTSEQASLDEQPAKPVALFGSFPCHPTVLGAENLALSADLPGAYRRQLQALLGKDTWIALTTGAAGDISTRHMRQGQGFDELERLGELLAKQAYALLPSARPLKLDLPHIHDTVVALEQKEPFSADKLAAYTHTVQERVSAELQAGNTAQARTLETVLQGLQAAQKRALTQGEQVRNVAVSAAVLGECALVAIPGELYNNLGAKIKQGTAQFVMLLGYTNGYVGYIPTREAYTEMDYEVLVSPFAPGSGERLENAIRMLLRQQ
ncbi:MAG: neutral/alkaline non-lysosomal ceramidase N-terminal domain-containing protein [Ktedonobacteraceae bacterium]